LPLTKSAKSSSIMNLSNQQLRQPNKNRTIEVNQ
jgi:hypothetical protein